MKSRTCLHALALAAIAIAPAMANSVINIVNVNAPGVGFNDPTPAAPVGGNTGTTVGQQRLFAFQYAASIWGSLLDSKVPISVQSSFVPLACNATSATLGSAGAIQVFGNFPNAPRTETWYHVALANRLAGADLAPGPVGTTADDIVARFNSSLGQSGCLTGTGWYYGLDGNHGNDIDLVTVLLHEFAHGLGFSTFMNKSTGALLVGFPDTYLVNMRDNTLGVNFDAMTDTQRATATIDTRRVVWTGLKVKAAVPATLAPGTPGLTVNSPSSIAGLYAVGTATFGAALTSPGITGNIVVGLDPADAAGPSVTDGCSPLTNAAAIAGNIALLDRGTCGFVIKAKNAQNAGAIGVVIADNVAGSPPAGLGGSDPTITIPAVRISLADGNTIKATLASSTVNATMSVNMAVLAGADPAGYALLYTPNPVVSGSSLSHWDTIATPNLLMEPNINADLTHDVDLTLPLMYDVGWIADKDLDGVPDDRDACPLSDLSATVNIRGCSPGVTNTLMSNGCTINDKMKACLDAARNGGDYASCVATTSAALAKAGIISPPQVGKMQACAAPPPAPTH